MRLHALYLNSNDAITYCTWLLYMYRIDPQHCIPILYRSQNKFEKPSAVVTDASDKIYVKDNHEVCVFDRDGKFVTSFGRGVLKKPCGKLLLSPLLPSSFRSSLLVVRTY